MCTSGSPRTWPSRWGGWIGRRTCGTRRSWGWPASLLRSAPSLSSSSSPPHQPLSVNSSKSGHQLNFYPLDFSLSRIGVNRCVSNKRTIKVYVSCFQQWATVTQHTWQRPCISVVPEAMHEASWGPLKGTVSAQKALRGSENETRELLGGRNRRE